MRGENFFLNLLQTKQGIQMRKPPKSVWLPALMALYAVVFFVYEFFVREVGFTPRNLSVMAGAAIMIAAVWWINRMNEKRKDQTQSDSEQKQNPKQ